MSAPVLIMAGGTGGHIFPGLAVADELRSRGVPVSWLGAEGGMETRVVPAHGLELHTVAVGGLRGKGVKTRLLAPLMLARALFESLTLLRRLRPRCVLSMGGYVAGPAGVAARLAGIPLVVHEQNAIAGFTNRKLATFARKVLTGFPNVLPKGEWVGNPVRARIAQLPPPAQRFADRNGRPRLLVLGGSLGARTLNLAVPRALGRLAAAGATMPEVVHQTGERGLQDALDAYTAAGVAANVVPFIEDMAGAYAWTDVVVCRAGALTVAELCAAGLEALLVPFPHAVDDHQTANARAMVDAGGARLVADATLATPDSPDLLAKMLDDLLGDRARILSAANASRTLAKPDAAATIARHCMEVSA
ncbi:MULTISPECIES: undecaprenyldiphospho-muramoylpentapeptide beta-N-acetylglucosaminyltransferase [Luteibacter]|uniref:UDP-N-acetylglucosamine--N-acetylmuramyl-(pentapeptide) pyrophosphoryl-undecaprenol N-acetylglucosamine transferase n=1 Tax=Luteibacter flocculans TaxID=2780091 RepID=A0ABY4T4Y2_9GAMM|nr:MULTISPECIES: undecaprenyldiphospho-muramoylpentapeptide beta-N-acetylglucosaminyltransferase [Luteibacter]URL57954.1 undecaprenyldiphospho-muramoylpentapeptide beta-N-acetylglucosaminyltransferase [Luteibacter flocculans]SFW43004.1 UDP-N-acetylglucosamine-N-acetylmuramylpentapeptide N-acetylglucosamine transferase [Luteibacter sp. UNCMF366Tsu5.1]